MLDGTLTELPATTHPAAASLSDSEIAVRLQSGDRAAWHLVYDRYSVDIWRYVSRLIGNDPDAIAEIVQEAFMAAARGSRNYDEERGTLWSWLTGIAHRQTSGYFRRQTRHRRITEEKTQSQFQRKQQANEEQSNPVHLFEQHEVAELVRVALSRMSGEHARLLVAKYMDRLSVQEIQDRVGGTSDSVRSKLRRARSEFREVFERLNDGGPNQ